MITMYKDKRLFPPINDNKMSVLYRERGGGHFCD